MGDMFLWLEGITGESKRNILGKTGWIEIMSFSFGVDQQGSAEHGGGLTTGRARFNDLQIAKKQDASSPKMFLFTSKGHHFPNASIVMMKAVGKSGASQDVYYQCDFKELILSHWGMTGFGEGDIPTENLSLNVNEMKYVYKTQESSGGLGGQVDASWNVKKMEDA